MSQSEVVPAAAAGMIHGRERVYTVRVTRGAEVNNVANGLRNFLRRYRCLGRKMSNPTSLDAECKATGQWRRIVK